MLALTSLSGAALAPRIKVDHVTVAGRHLGAMQKLFDAVGIPTQYGGRHSNAMTEMAIAGFPDGSYLELIAAQPGANAAAHDWGRFIEGEAGLCAWAIAVPGIEAEAERLKRAGTVITLQRGGRRRLDGVEIRWVTAGLGPGPHGSFFPFLIEDQTPRELRAYPHGSPSAPAFEGVALVVIAVNDLDAAVARWRALFGLSAPQRQSDGWLGANLAWFPETPVVLASPRAPDGWLASRLGEFGEAPCAVVLRARAPVTHAKHRSTQWFERTIGWFDPDALGGARVGVDNGR